MKELQRRKPLKNRTKKRLIILKKQIMKTQLQPKSQQGKSVFTYKLFITQSLIAQPLLHSDNKQAKSKATSQFNHSKIYHFLLNSNFGPYPSISSTVKESVKSKSHLDIIFSTTLLLQMFIFATFYQKGDFSLYYNFNLTRNRGNCILSSLQFKMNCLIFGLLIALSIAVQPYRFFIFGSHPLRIKECIASQFWLLTAIISGVLPHWSLLSISAPRRISISMRGYWLLIAAICKALQLYLSSIEISMGKPQSSMLVTSLRSFVQIARSILNRLLCGKTVAQRLCHAMVAQKKVNGLKRKGLGAQRGYLGNHSQTVKGSH